MDTKPSNQLEGVPAQTDNPEQPNLPQKQDLFGRGLRWFGLGVLCMALSFCITFFFYQSDGSSITWMYILTGMGTLAITKGLADLFGF
ncbi:MAG: hypothetical protein KGS48_16780 [Bacteroidetes bacterium]|nr:hypothetical protein [Bacteroidota bacterium]